MKVKKIFSTLLATTLISQSLLPIMQVRAEETQYSENSQAIEAKADAMSTAGTEVEKRALYDTSDAYWIARARSIINFVTKDGVIKIGSAIGKEYLANTVEVINKINNSSSEKAELVKGFLEMKRQYEYNSTLENDIQDLFFYGTTSILKSYVTQKTIDNLEARLPGVVEENWRGRMGNQLSLAQNILNEESKDKAAKEAVNNLFKDSTHASLNDNTVQATIDAAKNLVDGLPTGEVKTQLTAEIKKAQELLDKTNQEAAAEKAGKEAVNNLFKDASHTTLADKTTQATIDAAKNLVDALPSGEVKTELTAEIKKAQELLDKTNQEAAAEKAGKEAVNNLFKDSTHTSLSDKTTQATIDAAKNLVDGLPTGEVKTQLTAEIKKAQDFLDKKNQEAAAEKAAKEAVNNLFKDASHTTLNDKTTQVTIDAAKKLVDALPTGEVKTQLAAEIKKAQDFLDKKNQEAAAEKAAKEAVNNLFKDASHTTLNDKTTQATIDAAKKLVDGLPAGEMKTQLTAEIKKAQDFLDKKNQEAAAEKAAKEAVNNLFKDASHTTLNDKTTQVTIDAAKKLVDALPTGEVKTQLAAEIKKAQDFLDKKNQEAAAEKAAKEAVNNLFKDASHTTLNDKTTQATIDAAKKLVDGLPAGEMKTQLTAEIKKAQDFLDKKNQEAAAEKAAKEAVNNLFKDASHTTLNDKTTQVTIDAAKKLVDALPTGEVKTQLAAEIKKAQDFLDKKNQEAAAEKAAKEAVNNLFKDASHTTLNDKTTQATIDAAKKLVDGLPAGEMKTQLAAEIKKAQDFLDKKNQEAAAEKAAKEAVNNLFKDASHTTLNDKTTQATIDAAKKLVDALPTGEVKTQLAAEIKKAQDILSDDYWITIATQKLTQLLDGGISSKVVGEDLTEVQEYINNIQSNQTKKNELSTIYMNAIEQFVYNNNLEKSIKELFQENGTSLKPDVTQKMIDNLKSQLSGVVNRDWFGELFWKLYEAQNQLTNQNGTKAKEAVDKLFTNSSHTSLNEKTTQATIDAAKNLVDALPSGEMKTQLTTEIKKAQDLLDKKNQEAVAEKTAKEAVNNLFKDVSHTTLNDKTTQATIDAAKKLVDGLPTGEVKTKLTAEIKKAQDLLDKKNQEAAAEKAGKEAVNNLFKDASHTTLNDKTTQATIDAAKKLVDGLPTGEVKTQLTAEIKKAQDFLDKKNQETAEKTAKEAVNNLFKDSTHASLSDKTTQATIDAAKNLVDTLPTGEVKSQLTAEIKKAQELLDKKNQEAAAEKAGKEAVNNLFKDSTHASLSDKTTQATIDAAKNLVDALPTGEVKSQLTAEIKKAQDFLDKKNQEVAAKEAVNNLFKDASHTTLNDKTTQATIDAAKKLVDALPTGEVKTELTAEIKKAQDFLDKKNQEVAAKEAVNNLFKDNTHASLSVKTTQATIDAAKKLVDALPTGEVKTQLTAEIKKAQDLLTLVDDSKIDVDDYVIGNSRYVKGNISGKVIKKAVLEINGELKKSINVSTGPFQYWAMGQIMNEKDEVFVIGLDIYGNEVKRSKVNIIPFDEAEKINLTVSSFLLGKDNYITGTYEGSIKTVALRIDGVLTQKIAVKDGVIKYYAKGKITNSSSTVELVAMNVWGKEVAVKPVKVSDVIASMKVDLYKLGERYIQGTYSGDAKYMAIEINGIKQQTIGIANGILKYYAKGKINSVDDKINIILMDGNKTEIQRTPLKILATSGTLAIDSYKLNASHITGSFTGDIVKVRLVINGVTQRVIPASAGKVQYYARNLVTKVTDNVLIEGLDASNNVLDSKTVEITN